MKKARLLIGLILVFLLLLGLMPAAMADACPGSPYGSHLWIQYSSGSWVETCVWEGWIWEECYYCGETRNWNYERDTFHNWNDWTIIKYATCDSPGSRQRSCSNCGNVETEMIFEAHNYGPWTILEEATDHSPGLREHTCTVCGTTDQSPYDPEGTLRRGDKGDAVKMLQQLLINQGFLANGAADGDFGKSTEKAVTAFQASVGLTADGVAWPQTIRLLDPDTVPEAPTVAESFDCCESGLRWTENGELERTLHLCQSHSAIQTACAALPEESRELLWASALDYEYETMLGKAGSEDDKAVILQEQQAFAEWLEAYGEYLAAERPGEEAFVKEELNAQRVRHIARLCRLNDANAPLPELPAYAGTGSVPPLERCALCEVGANNALTGGIQLCETHQAIALATSAVPGEQALMLWRLSEDSLMKTLLADAEGPTHGVVYTALLNTERDAFDHWVECYGQLAALMRPGEPNVAAAVETELLMEYVVERCAITAR